MAEVSFSAVHESRRKPLAVCVASLFAMCSPAMAIPVPVGWTVNSCDGDAYSGDAATKTGTLRFAAANAADGETVDLSTLTCPGSKISLTTGDYIAIPQPSLTIKGSAASVLTIDASGIPGVTYGNIFYHTGNGTLKVQDLALTGGRVNHQYSDSKGGCIYSKGNVDLDHVSVSSCSANSNYFSSSGGGVYAKGNVDLSDSTVSGNSATSGKSAYGGGVHAKGNLTLQFSTLRGNNVDAPHSWGGGARSDGDFLAGYSTVSDNKAHTVGYGGGLDLQGKFNTISSSTISGNTSLISGGVEVSSHVGAGSTFLIVNSTISGNHAELWTGGLRVDAAIAKLYNSTIAFNTATAGGPTAASGVQLQEDFNEISAILESNLIANNTYGSNESDLGEQLAPGFSLTINGGLAAVPANNLIRVASVAGLPLDTKTDCPLLGKLRDNGGLTQTHALLSHSLAIDAGNDYFGGPSSFDQRGFALINGTLDFPRASGPLGDQNPKADIGAHEVQQDDVVFDTEFEGCP
jgi:hypothetical protein